MQCVSDTIDGHTTLKSGVLAGFGAAGGLAVGVVGLVVYQAEVEDGAGGAHLALFACFVGLLGLTLEPVVLNLFCARDLLGVVQTLQVVLLGRNAVRRRIGLCVALLELLPKGKAARSSTLEAEAGLSDQSRWRGMESMVWGDGGAG